MSFGHWTGWLLDRWDVIRQSYWFFPAQMTVFAGLAALAAVEFDRRMPPHWAESVPWLTGVSAEGARTVLSTIAGSMMTVTSVVFSITVVALTLTSSQFGPRLLRTFLQDRSSQVALGTFVATFFYALLVLRAVQTPERVPYVATAGAVGLAVTSLFVLIFFIHHAVSSIQASSVIASVAREIETQIPLLFPERIGEERRDSPSPRDRERLDRLGAEGVDLRAQGEGYVRVVDDQALLELAQEHDLIIRLATRPGQFVTVGALLARLGSPAHLDDEFKERLRGLFILGDHRTPMQDLGFLTDQLAEMAVRALSPGINDPKTAADCVRRLGGVLAALAERTTPSGLRFDSDGVLRVAAEPTRFDAIVASSFDPIRRHGASEPQVAIALLDAIRAGADNRVDEERRRVLEEHAREVRAGFESARGGSTRDAALVEAVFERTMASLEVAPDRPASERAAGGVSPISNRSGSV